MPTCKRDNGILPRLKTKTIIAAALGFGLILIATIAIYACANKVAITGRNKSRATIQSLSVLSGNIQLINIAEPQTTKIEPIAHTKKKEIQRRKFFIDFEFSTNIRKSYSNKKGPVGPVFFINLHWKCIFLILILLIASKIKIFGCKKY
jgi:hypothetical protein